MLIITRVTGQSITFPEHNIEVGIHKTSKRGASLFISAPKSIKVLRGEHDESKTRVHSVSGRSGVDTGSGGTVHPEYRYPNDRGNNQRSAEGTDRTTKHQNNDTSTTPSQNMQVVPTKDSNNSLQQLFKIEKELVNRQEAKKLVKNLTKWLDSTLQIKS